MLSVSKISNSATWNISKYLNKYERACVERTEVGTTTYTALVSS